MGNIAQLFGGSSEKTDRKQQLDARDQSRSIFNYAMPEAKQSEASGSSLSGQAGDYFGRLLRSGRTEQTQQAAPAVNQAITANDAAKRREALTGTGRTGGTVEADRSMDANTDAQIANTVNETGMANKAVAAEGAAQVGGEQMRQALGLLGLSAQQINALMENTRQSRVDSKAIRQQTYNGIAADIGGLISNIFMPKVPGAGGGVKTADGLMDSLKEVPFDFKYS